MSQPTSDTESRPSTSAWKLNDIFEALQDINLEGKIEDQETEQLGLGSSSDIFRARYTAHNKIVAVKRVRLLLLDNIADARAIGREVRLWSKLNHPNVLPLLGYFLSGPKAIPNFVSEWMEKGTLTDYMKNRPFDVREMCEMVCGVASGLHYIHTEHDMIHADLKGSNIFVSNDGRPLLADFGLSVSSSSTSLAATTFHGQKGSLRWMAKELHSNSPDALENPKHTTMTDMWAFGMVISELLNREIPYGSIVDRRVGAVILGGQLPQEPDFLVFPDRLTFRGLWAIARVCWLDDPLRRPSALDVQNELTHFMTRTRDAFPVATKANANVTGKIAIRGVDGKYMRVTPTNGLEFGIQTLEDNAKFDVQHHGSKIGLRGSTGNFVNMYYNDDIKCEGPHGGVVFSIVYLQGGQINFTISGYDGQGGRTRFLSSQAGYAAYGGSLAAKEFEDFTCRFTIENL